MRKLKNEELARLSVDQFKAAAKTPLVVVLDNLRSMNNIGSAFRTADAFLVEQILLCGITARPPHREIHKTALGATESVIWQYYENTADALRYLQNHGYRVLAVEQTTGSIPLHRFQPEAGQPYALVFGHEIKGVSDEAVALADGSVEIPQLGTKHSLNVAVSIGVVLWDFACKMQAFA